jgi:hypothetical protein
VKPEVVVVEVCKDRTPLLVDPETMTKAPDTWTCTRIDFDGLPSAKKDGDNDEEKDKDDKDKEKTPEQKAAAAAEKALAREVWPTAEDLAPLLRTRIGRIITTSEVEGDVATLEATGLFSRVRPACDAGRPGDAPLFCAVKAEGEAGGLELEYVAPLGCTRFVVQPRSLPAIKSLGVRLDSSLKVGWHAWIGAGRGSGAVATVGLPHDDRPWKPAGRQALHSWVRCPQTWLQALRGRLGVSMRPSNT